MKLEALIACLSITVLSSTSLFAGGTYPESLKAADDALAARQHNVALKEIDVALTQASNDGEKALAMAKKSYVLAFHLQDFNGARSVANGALAYPDIAPVARVTALQALAQCQMMADKDYNGALTHLQEALALEGVDWAKPALTLSLADCYRSTGQLEQALATYRAVVEMPDAGPDLKSGAHLNIGFIYQYDRKDAAMAREAYAKAVNLRPDLQQEVQGHLNTLP